MTGHVVRTSEAIKIALEDGTNTYITWVPLAQDKPWPVAFRDAVAEAAIGLVGSVARDVAHRD